MSPDEAAHGQTRSLEESPDFPVAPFAKRNFIPDVAAGPSRTFDALESRQTPLEIDARLQLFKLLGSQLAQYSNGVAADDFEARVHQLVSQLTIGREQ